MLNAALHYTPSIMTIMARAYQTFEIERVLPPKKLMLCGNASETTQVYSKQWQSVIAIKDISQTARVKSARQQLRFLPSCSSFPFFTVYPQIRPFPLIAGQIPFHFFLFQSILVGNF